MAKEQLSRGVALTPEQLGERAAAWMQSARGQCAIRKSMDRASRDTDRLREARKIDPRTLNEPVTI